MRSLLPTNLVETRPIEVRIRGQIVQERRITFIRLRIILLYILGITWAEVLTTVYVSVTGLIGHGLLLVMLFVHCGTNRDTYIQRMLITLALVPLSRLLSLSLSSLHYSSSIFYLLIGIQLLIAALLALRYTGYTLVYLMYIEPRFSMIGLQVLIGLCGIGLGYVEFLILRPRPIIEAFKFQRFWLPALIFLVIAGFLEELIFRGLMQKSFVDVIGGIRGVVLVSLLYAVLHFGYHSVLYLLFVFVVALLFGYAVLRTRSIVGVALAHGVSNFFLFLVFPFFIW